MLPIQGFLGYIPLLLYASFIVALELCENAALGELWKI